MHCETTSDDPKYGFWGILARKAKSILDEDNQFDSSSKMNDTTTTINPQVSSLLLKEPPPSFHFCFYLFTFPYHFYLSFQLYQSPQSSQGDARIDNARLRKRLDAITSSLNNFGDTLGNAFEVCLLPHFLINQFFKSHFCVLPLLPCCLCNCICFAGRSYNHGAQDC